MNSIFSEQLILCQSLAVRIFQRSAVEHKLARAYLLVGHSKEDKWRLVFELAAYLNCARIKSGQQQQSCFIQQTDLSKDKWCMDCRWIETNEHPQALIKLTGQNNKSGSIAVKEARALVEEVGKTSSYFRVMVIEEAGQEFLQRSAANTLLKTIEEPRSQVLMIFFARATSDVLPTITSRCQIINISSKQYNQYFSLISPNNLKQFSLSGLNSEIGQNNETYFDKFMRENSNLVDAINLIESIQSLLKEGIDLETILDYFIAKDLIQSKHIFNPNGSRYAKELFVIGEIVKEQNKHYVSEKALIETFVHAWHRLKKTGINPLKIRR